MRLALIGTALAALVGCATPRVITSMSSDGDSMKLVYARAGSTETGVLECDVQPDGSLTGCKRLPVTFND